MTRHRPRRSSGGRLLIAALGVTAVAVATLTATGPTVYAGAASVALTQHTASPDRHKPPRPRPTRTPTRPPATTAAPTTTPPTTPAGSTTAPTTRPPSPTGSTTAPQAGFVPVNQAEWAADLAAFEARTPAPVPASNGRDVPEFHALCTTFHRNDDDPIVVPNLEGASHNHTFFGNPSTNHATTYESLKNSPGTCNPAGDRSAYWVPTLSVDGTPVLPREVTVYYGSRHTRAGEHTKIKPFPRGLRMIVGNAGQTTGNANDHGFWCSAGERGRTADDVFPICRPGGDLIRYVVFPECWDGRNLDSPDHKSHMSQAQAGACPPSHPVPVPTVTYTMTYGGAAATSTNGFTLASGGGSPYSMHGDFFNAWEPAALAARVKDCLTQHAKCNAAGQL